MRVVHRKPGAHVSKAELLEQARQYEAEGDLKKAGVVYEKLVRSDRYNEHAYNRLMILYRKQKEPQRELSIIKQAMAAFEEKYASSVKTIRSKKVSTLSSAFLKAAGLSDKKGKLLFLPEPLAKWSRRKLLLEKKLKKDKGD
jgi:hypothetical protein